MLRTNPSYYKIKKNILRFLKKPPFKNPKCCSFLQQMEMVTQWMEVTARVFHFMLQLLWYSVYSHLCAYNAARDSTTSKSTHVYNCGQNWTKDASGDQLVTPETIRFAVQLNGLVPSSEIGFCWFKSAMKTVRFWCWISVVWYMSFHIQQGTWNTSIILVMWMNLISIGQWYLNKHIFSTDLFQEVALPRYCCGYI